MIGGRIKIRSANSDTQRSAIIPAHTANNQNYIQKEMRKGCNSRGVILYRWDSDPRHYTELCAVTDRSRSRDLLGLPDP